MGLQINREQIIEYLLGQLSAQERKQVEDAYLADDDAFEEMLIVEEELIHDYVEGRLSATRRALFEKNYLTSPERRAEIEFTQSLLSSIQKNLRPEAGAPAPVSPHPASPQRASFLQYLRQRFRHFMWGLAVASALVVITLLAELYGAYRLNARSQQVEKAREAILRQQDEIDRQRAQLDQEMARLQSGQSGGLATVITSRLMPVRVRGEQQTQVLRIPSGSTVVVLQAPLNSADDKLYQAVLTGDDTEMLRLNSLTARREGSAGVIEIPVPASALNRRFYMLTIKSEADDEEVGLFTFEAVKN
ncbi:MAG: hypothetical protein ACLGJB_26135 [Blastocatellia bacterium]